MSCRVSVSTCEIVTSPKMALFQTWMAEVSTDPWSRPFRLAMVACCKGTLEQELVSEEALFGTFHSSFCFVAVSILPRHDWHTESEQSRTGW